MTDFTEQSLKIPAYLNGTLSEAEVREIEALAQTHKDFAADIEFQRAINEAFAESAETKSDLEFGWARLSKAIDVDAQSASDMQPAQDTQFTKPENVTAIDKSPLRLWQIAAALLAAVVAVQGTMLMSTQAGDEDAQYVLASVEGSHADVWITPKADVSVQSLTEFLTQTNGIISQGPDAEGAYRVTYRDQLACKNFQEENELFQVVRACQSGD